MAVPPPHPSPTGPQFRGRKSLVALSPRTVTNLIFSREDYLFPLTPKKRSDVENYRLLCTFQVPIGTRMPIILQTHGLLFSGKYTPPRVNPPRSPLYLQNFIFWYSLVITTSLLGLFTPKMFSFAYFLPSIHPPLVPDESQHGTKPQNVLSCSPQTIKPRQTPSTLTMHNGHSDVTMMSHFRDFPKTGIREYRLSLVDVIHK